MNKKKIITGTIFSVSVFMYTNSIAWNGTLGSVDGQISEADRALLLIPNIQNGKRLFEEKACKTCHTPDGMGNWAEGGYPRIAGQYSTVILKQLSDIRSKNRDAPVMIPYAKPKHIGGKQALADVAAYISSLKGTENYQKGNKEKALLGKALYQSQCTSCHGQFGEGSSQQRVPRLQGQHYGYLSYQLKNMKIGKRKRANPDMIKIISNISNKDLNNIAAYITYLKFPKKMIQSKNDNQVSKTSSIEKNYLNYLTKEAEQ